MGISTTTESLDLRKLKIDGVLWDNGGREKAMYNWKMATGYTDDGTEPFLQTDQIVGGGIQ